MQRPFTPGKVRSAPRASSALPAAALLLTGCARTQETTLSTEEDGSVRLGGVSAFGVHGNAAVCAELTFQAGFEEDAVKLLTGLLDGFRYSSQENAD